MTLTITPGTDGGPRVKGVDSFHSRPDLLQGFLGGRVWWGVDGKSTGEVYVDLAGDPGDDPGLIYQQEPPRERLLGDLQSRSVRTGGIGPRSVWGGGGVGGGSRSLESTEPPTSVLLRTGTQGDTGRARCP